MPAQADELGIVTAARERRATFARFIDKQVAQRLEEPATKIAIARMVDDRLKQEIQGIVARRAAKAAAEIDAAMLPVGPAVKTILDAVAAVTEIPVRELLGPRRARPQARARQIAYHIFRRLRPDLSLPAIGRVMGMRDHTTILSGLRRGDLLMETDVPWRHSYDAVTAKLKGDGQ